MYLSGLYGLSDCASDVAALIAQGHVFPGDRIGYSANVTVATIDRGRLNSRSAIEGIAREIVNSTAGMTGAAAVVTARTGTGLWNVAIHFSSTVDWGRIGDLASIITSGLRTYFARVEAVAITFMSRSDPCRGVSGSSPGAGQVNPNVPPNLPPPQGGLLDSIGSYFGIGGTMLAIGAVVALLILTRK